VVLTAFWETGAKAAAEAMREARMSFMVVARRNRKIVRMLCYDGGPSQAPHRVVVFRYLEGFAFKTGYLQRASLVIWTPLPGC
jgi:hypothetical protein